MFAPVMCIKDQESCSQFDTCGVSDAWRSLGKVVTDHLKSINFQDMIESQSKRREQGAAEKEDWNYY
jgi:DNA-binding IscR family transcriptional regulator